MNINVNDTKIGSLLDLSELDTMSKKTDEKIRSIFGEKEPIAATLKLSQEGKTAASAKTEGKQTEQSGAVQQKKPQAALNIRDLVRTGYASIDNAIIDSLNGVSDEVRQYAYDIVRNDFLLENAAGISESERQDLISRKFDSLTSKKHPQSLLWLIFFVKIRFYTCTSQYIPL